MQEDARKVPADGTTAASRDLLVQKFSPLPTGTRMGELSIQSVLGAGEFGITYIAVQEGNNRRFVVKEYLPRSIAFRDGPTVRVSSANTPAYAWGLDRFLSEGRALAKLKHPAIVPVQAVFEGNGTGYIVMAHETGRELNVWLHELRRPPTQQEYDKILEPILAGLGVLHAKSIFHLDLQPANIVMREGGTPVLIDFGAVRLGMRRRLNLPAPADARPFMAPEVIAGDQSLIGPTSDIYAMAAVLYTLTTGTSPPDAERRVLRDPLVPATEAAKSKLRPSFLQAIDNGLRYRPDDRPSSISAWMDDLLRPEMSAPLARKQAEARAASDDAAFTDGETGDGSRVERASIDYDDGPETSETLMENPSFRPIFFGLAGAVGGAIVGALLSTVVASLVWSSCTTDQCVAPVLPYTLAAGVVAGLYFGARYGRLTIQHGSHYKTDRSNEQ